ncbi:MAG: hypothetical protein RIS54_2302, partial [Verrucomicrobiota bacterium]
MALLLIGGFFGVLALLLPLYRAQKQAARLEEEKQQVIQERELVVDFMHHMVEA